MRFWFDTEFIEDGKTIELISIGITSEDGRNFYVENSECDLSRGCEWVQKNVIPHLGGPSATRAEIARQVREFVGEDPEFWAYFCSYDWVVLCQLYGRMVDLPKSWPMFCRDVKQLQVDRGLTTLPKQWSVAHNALNDAVWTRSAWEYVMAFDAP